METCETCGENVMWHRVYNTRAGIRAFCNLPRQWREKSRAQRAVSLDEEAKDAWGRIHRMKVGTQQELF